MSPGNRRITYHLFSNQLKFTKKMSDFLQSQHRAIAQHRYFNKYDFRKKCHRLSNVLYVTAFDRIEIIKSPTVLVDDFSYVVALSICLNCFPFKFHTSLKSKFSSFQHPPSCYCQAKEEPSHTSSV